MAIFELLFGRKSRPPQILFSGTKVVLLQLDISINEEHIYENRIPQYPIDSTSTISDHIWMTPDRLNIEGQISNAPLKAWYLPENLQYNNNTTALGGRNTNRVLTAYEVLLALSGRKLVRNAEDNAGKGVIYNPVVVDIITNLCVFSDMVIESLRIPRNAGVLDELIFQVQFVKVTRATVHDADIQYVNDKIYGATGVGDQNSSTTNGGVQPNTDTKSPKDTILRGWVDGGKKGLKEYGPAVKTFLLGS